MPLDFRKITPFGHALPITQYQAEFEINQRLDRCQIITKINHFHETTDGRTVRRTDGQRSPKTTIGIFFEKKERKTTKKVIDVWSGFSHNPFPGRASRSLGNRKTGNNLMNKYMIIDN